MIGYEVSALKQNELLHKQPIKNKFLRSWYIIFHMQQIVGLPHPWQANFADIVSYFKDAVNDRLRLQLGLFSKDS